MLVMRYLGRSHGKNSRPVCCAQQQKSRAGNDNRKRVRGPRGVSRFSDLGRRKDIIIEVNHGHQVSNTLPSQVPEFLFPLNYMRLILHKLPYTKVTLSENHAHL